MAITVETQESNQGQEQNRPLLREDSAAEIETTLFQKVVKKTLVSTATLANLLPTGTVLFYQLISPIVTGNGSCDTEQEYLTAALIALCGIFCFLSSFTDSFKDSKGNVCYGFATIHGLWVIDCPEGLTPEIAANYRLRFIDFVHAFMTLLVFAAVALFDSNTVSCFYPSPSDDTERILKALPVGIGAICSGFFVVFPTKRHGIGFPLSSS